MAATPPLPSSSLGGSGVVLHEPPTPAPALPSLPYHHHDQDEDEDGEGEGEGLPLALPSSSSPTRYPWKGRWRGLARPCMGGVGWVDAFFSKWIPQGGILASIFELLSATLGAGTLSLPFAFRESGMILAMIIMIVGGVAAYYSIHLLIISSTITKRNTYEDMTRHVFGRGIEILLDVSIIIFTWGSTVAYMVAIGDILPPVLKMLGVHQVLPHYLLERWILMTASTVFIIYPLSLLKKLGSLRYTAFLGFLASLYLVLIVFIRTTQQMHDNGPDPDGELQYFKFNTGLFIASPIIFYAYSSHVNIFTIYSELRTPTLPRINTVIIGDVIAAFFVYGLIGLFGYLSFFEDTKGNILKNYSADDIAVQLGAITLVLSIIFNIPLNNHPCRITIDWMLFGPASKISKNLRFYTEATAIVFIALIISIAVPNITVVFGLLGATATSFCCYLMPAILYLKVADFKLYHWRAIPCWVLIILSSVSSVISTVIYIKDIVNGDTD